MTIHYDPGLIKKLKKVDVRIRKSFEEKILIFAKNTNDPQLNNHPLKREWLGYRSIDITTDWRAIYEEILVGEEEITYFVTIGTHKELYKFERTN